MKKAAGNKATDRLAALRATVGAVAVPDPAEAAPEPRPTAPAKSGVIGRRRNAIGAVASGRAKMVTVVHHPPARIRPWAGHNRDYQALDAKNCADLIAGFERAGQQIPAIVRRVKGEGDVDFELVVGARRHWTAAYLGRDLLVEVRELDDRQAFVLQDLENRDRVDVSDHERAVDYRGALERHFGGSRQEMARFLRIDPGNFSRLLQLAELPEPIVAAYADRHELKVHHGAIYRKLLETPESRRRVLERARALRGRGLGGKQVLAELKRAVAGGGKTTAHSSRGGERFGALELARRVGARRAVVNVTLPETFDAMSIEGLKEDFTKLLASLGGKSGTR